jgi:hypothetical protein
MKCAHVYVFQNKTQMYHVINPVFFANIYKPALLDSVLTKHGKKKKTLNNQKKI